MTAWQLRTPGQVVNDHADADYDAAVLERLAALHAERPRGSTADRGRLPRLGRLRRGSTGRSSGRVAGDQRFVASPRVDSYHGAWFELHEDLIQLAGRRREDEVAAGRA